MNNRWLAGVIVVALVIPLSGCGQSDADMSPDCKMMASLGRDLIDQFDSLPDDDPTGIKDSLSSQVDDMRSKFKAACGRDL